MSEHLLAFSREDMLLCLTRSFISREFRRAHIRLCANRASAERGDDYEDECFERYEPHFQNSMLLRGLLVMQTIFLSLSEVGVLEDVGT